MSLNDTERDLAREIGFDEGVLRAIRRRTRKKLQRLTAGPRRRPVPAAGVSVAVKGGREAEALMTAMSADLRAVGCMAFWSERREPNGLKETDEVAVIQTVDPYAPIILRETDGANYGIFTDDVIARLRAWEQVSKFRVVGAASSWVALQFDELPEKICAFAEEVFLFCPDSVGQGVGLLREKDDPGRFAAARALCPEVSARFRPTGKSPLAQLEGLDPEMAEALRPAFEAAASATPEDVGIRLLAESLHCSKYLFLWWD